jgi:hypothetical protein
MPKPKMSSSLQGKISSTLIGIACAQGSEGKVNFATPFVDDEGVDLIFFRKGSSAEALLAQVKSNRWESKKAQSGQFIAQVRRQSFNARKGYYLIFACLDHALNKLHNPIWFVSSKDFERETRVQNKKRKNLTFSSRFDSKKGRWKKYRMNLEELPKRVEQELRETRKQ